MNLQSFICGACCHRLVLVVVLASLVYQAVADDVKYEACAPWNCGYGLNISYPFWISGEKESYCGYPNFEITCVEKFPVLNFPEGEFIIEEIFHANHSILLVDALVYNDTCGAPPHHISFERTPFNLSSTNADFFFYYNCTLPPPPNFAYPVNCPSNYNYSFALFPKEALQDTAVYSAVGSCSSPVSVPVHVNANTTSLATMDYRKIMEMGFLLNWTAIDCSDCEESEGRCGFENNNFVCFCQDGPHSQTCNDGESNRRKKLVVGFASAGGTAGGIAIIVAIIIFIYRSRQRKKYNQSSFASRSTSSIYFSRTDSEKGNVYHGLPIFDYDELKNATNNFDPAAELGDGGFGTVFKGKLQDGRVVAVKRLYESNYKRVEQFVNEVEILARLRHPNLVSLYGCTSRQSRRLLLVYEYVPNGTVADHIHGDLAKPGSPPWSTRLNIAIETANALVYLHASVVIHRDVKTNNILLNENFSVKVADFGLSRLFPLNATHVSTAPQGTPGYVDPEYHQCYQLTEKSDVYSFGVVLMELISSLPAVDITRHRHEINLSALAISKIQSHALHELVDPNLGFDTDYRTGEMITAVAELGFQCLEQGHDMRPSMEEVLKTLKEIQNRGHDMEKSDQTDNISDDAVLLKNNPLTSSPVSVTAKWVSNDSTPNASG
ncbi:LEAF RUST 10 DISEASE-RESISTANCE LOCUS RECEPTOR-LIKE PROTEIN KINASE-like 1.2 isoform X2 [Eucalyptus grandis]|uniref:LEAF RUST 10 DISEASE-RESISTANCE LOCUS RECEPTOR-LIKE PROTEIN KINASE-like 1.2 isoform X2 n=1 Tax=Eucalyptus grandis TaxID=71139 RepID=UPI00192EB8E1|nr:LEAF RUST 10 DISEASE-RESISTANCE LOCUS RECEPTOR-LIKE PROTEIN KINASE-like 1.2 isoform X2 [Eucalyptus grandis]